MKKFKEVAHLYIGCPCELRNRAGKGIVNFIPKYLAAVMTSDGVNLKPILRRLENMTTEEAIRLCKLGFVRQDTEIFIENISKTSVCFTDEEFGESAPEEMECFVRFNELNPQQFLFLLNLGFDLYGLIDTGEAIDAATLKQQSK